MKDTEDKQARRRPFLRILAGTGVVACVSILGLTWLTSRFLPQRATGGNKPRVEDNRDRPAERARIAGGYVWFERVFGRSRVSLKAVLNMSA